MQSERLGRSPSLYRPQSPWDPLAALGAALLILSVAYLAIPFLLSGPLPAFHLVPLEQAGLLRHRAGSPVVALLGQGTVIVLVLFAASLLNGRVATVLALNKIDGSTSALIAMSSAAIVFVAMIYGAARLNTHVIATAQHQSLNETGFLMLLINFAAMVFIGPAAEEFLFRGFLLSAFAKSGMGFWGAAVLTSALWAGIHIVNLDMAPFQILIIFGCGLGLSLLLQRTGSLWPCVIAHACYNAVPASLMIAFALPLAR